LNCLNQRDQGEFRVVVGCPPIMSREDGGIEARDLFIVNNRRLWLTGGILAGVVSIPPTTVNGCQEEE
jgi:hypothetical protein